MPFFIANQSPLTDANGALIVSNSVTAPGGAAAVSTVSLLPVYTVVMLGNTNVPINATDVALLGGAAGKSVRIKRITVALLMGAPTFVQIVRRSSANTGGTSTNFTPQAYDTASPASGAQGTLYTANPAGLGAVSGVMFAYWSAASESRTLTFDASPIILPAGANWSVALNFATGNGAVGSAGAVFEWEEL